MNTPTEVCVKILVASHVRMESLKQTIHCKYNEKKTLNSLFGKQITSLLSSLQAELLLKLVGFYTANSQTECLNMSTSNCGNV